MHFKRLLNIALGATLLFGTVACSDDDNRNAGNELSQKERTFKAAIVPRHSFVRSLQCHC